MSVASSVMSSISVVCDKKEHEEALDYVMIKIQRRLRLANQVAGHRGDLFEQADQPGNVIDRGVTEEDRLFEIINLVNFLLGEARQSAHLHVKVIEPPLDLNHDVVEGFFEVCSFPSHTTLILDITLDATDMAAR